MIRLPISPLDCSKLLRKDVTTATGVVITMYAIVTDTTVLFKALWLSLLFCDTDLPADFFCIS